MEEFPGDNPANIPKDTDPFDLPRSPAKVLDEVGHNFRIGINGFGSLGRAVFCEAYEKELDYDFQGINMTDTWNSYDRPYTEVVTVNDPHVDALQAASLLREDHARGRIGPTGLEVNAEAPDELKLKDPATGKTTTVCFRSESDPSRIMWQDPDKCVFYVVECSGKFTNVKQASAHIQLNYRPWEEEERGVLKVLIAASTTDAPRFYPRINLRDYQAEQSVFACAPPAGQANTETDDDVWQYSSHVLDLLNLALARDAAAASLWEVHEAGRLDADEESLFVSGLRNFLLTCAEGPSSEPFLGSGMFDGLLEMANSEFMQIWDTCKCKGCPGARSTRRVYEG